MTSRRSPTAPEDTPALVRAALRESLRIGYLDSTRSETGRLLATLAATRSGVIADLGTGCGVGAAWLRSGAPAGTRVVTVERDTTLAASAGTLFAGQGVEVIDGDWSTIDWRAYGVDGFSLISLDLTTARGARGRLVDLLAPGGLLVLDDLHSSWPFAGPEPVDSIVLHAWLREERLICTEVRAAPDASLLLAARR